MSVYIHSLHIYPIKSCQGISLDQAELVATGFKYDRHWMLVDSQGRFLTQRQHPQLARISTWLNAEALIVGIDNQQQLELPLLADDEERRQVQVWNDQCHAAIVSPQASRWFSDFLDLDCELVFLPESEQRRVDPHYAREDQIVGFADGFPLLVLSRESIDLLNSKLEHKVDINRFRANIVIDGCSAHAEDDWTGISVNGVDIDLAKPCSRCAIPSFDQSSAERHPTILKTLVGYRRRDGKVFFGQNGLHSTNGRIHVGDKVEIRR